jgi:hypothetical protein
LLDSAYAFRISFNYQIFHKEKDHPLISTEEKQRTTGWGPLGFISLMSRSRRLGTGAAVLNLVNKGNKIKCD